MKKQKIYKMSYLDKINDLMIIAVNKNNIPIFMYSKDQKEPMIILENGAIITNYIITGVCEECNYQPIQEEND